jgi:hypothetical protein
VALGLAAAAQSFVAPAGVATALLNKHTRTRALAQHGHGLHTMRWDSYLAHVASIHSKGCHWGHTSVSVRTRRYNNLFHPARHYSVGENIAYSTGWLTNASVLFDAFVVGAKGECSKFVAQGCPKVTKTNFLNWGHYSQIIWNTTTRVGCAWTLCSSNSPQPSYSGGKWTYLVCNYANAGNYLGRSYNYPGTSKYCSSAMCPTSTVLRLDAGSGSQTSADHHAHLPAWGIALIVIGVVAAAVVLTVVAFVVYERKKAAHPSSYNMDS